PRTGIPACVPACLPRRTASPRQLRMTAFVSPHSPRTMAPARVAIIRAEASPTRHRDIPNGYCRDRATRLPAQELALVYHRRRQARQRTMTDDGGETGVL